MWCMLGGGCVTAFYRIWKRGECKSGSGSVNFTVSKNITPSCLGPIEKVSFFWDTVYTICILPFHLQLIIRYPLSLSSSVLTSLSLSCQLAFPNSLSSYFITSPSGFGTKRWSSALFQVNVIPSQLQVSLMVMTCQLWL